MSWKQTVVMGVLIACLAAAAVWFLEDFQRQRMQAQFAAQVRAWLAELPVVNGPPAPPPPPPPPPPPV